MSEVSLASLLPIWRTAREAGVTYILTPSLGYVGGLELGTLDTRYAADAALASLGEGLARVVASAEDGTTLHFIYRAEVGAPEAELEEYEGLCAAAKAPALKAYVQGRVAWLRKRQMRRTRLYVFFSQDKAVMPRVKGMLGMPLVFGPTRKYGPKEHQAAVKGLGELRDRLMARLGGLGLGPRELTLDDVWRIHYELLNPTRAKAGIPPRVPPYDDFHSEASIRQHGDWLREYSEAELLVAEDVVETSRGCLRQGELYRRVHTLKVLPEGATEHDDGGMVLRAMRDATGPFGYTLAATVEVKHQAFAKWRLNAQHKSTEQVRKAFERWRSASVSQEAEDAAAQGGIRALFHEMQERSLKLAGLSVSILIEAPSVDALNRRSEVVKSAVQKARNMQVQDEEINQIPAFLAMLPSAGTYQLRKKGVTSGNAADLLPVSASWRGTRVAGSIFETPDGDSFRFDPCDDDLIPARHGVIVASTGSGKSFSMGMFALDFLATGVETVLIDNGWSWKGLTDVMGGVHVPISLSTPIAPFQAYGEMLDAKGKLDNTELDNLVRFIEVCVQDASRGAFDNIEKSVLSKALTWCYERRFKERPGERPLMSDFDAALGEVEWTHPDDKRIAEELRRRLEIFVSGIYSTFLNRPSKVDFSSPFLTFEMSQLGDNPSVRAIAMATVIEAISVRAKRRRRKTIVAIDEMHKYLRGDDATSAYFEYAWRTMRKYDTGMWAITQDLHSFVEGGGAGGAILRNSPLRIFLKHLEGHELVARHFRFSGRLAEAFKGLEMRGGHYSDVLVQFGEASQVVRLQVTPLAYWILTTHPKDKELMERARAKNPTLDQFTLLTELAARYPNGVVGAV